MKLLSKQRDGSKVQRKYEPAQTLLQRLLAAHPPTAEVEARLQAVYHSLDPVRLLQQIVVVQDALWHPAVMPSIGRRGRRSGHAHDARNAFQSRCLGPRFGKVR